LAQRVTLPNNWQPRDYQLPAWTYLENGGRHAELIWHRRSGKDEVGLHRTACAAFERVAGYWYMLPEYNQARKAVWDAINPKTGKKRIDEAFPHELRAATRSQQMQIEFKNGSHFQVVGSDNPDSLVGAPPAGIVYSEWALSNPNVRAYLRPIIARTTAGSSSSPRRGAGTTPTRRSRPPSG
jgi:phage terminase large subunit